MVKRLYTESECNQIFSMWYRGASLDVIAERLHHPRGCVQQVLRTFGWYRWWKHKRTCSPAKARLIVRMYANGLTSKQVSRRVRMKYTTVVEVLKHMGVPLRPPVSMPGSKNPAWKGGVRVRKGYREVYYPSHPGATLHGFVSVHRLVMEHHLGRKLRREEVVHHIDDNTSNNHISNLRLYSTNAEHLADTLKGKCPNWTEDGRRRIRERPIPIGEQTHKAILTEVQVTEIRNRAASGESRPSIAKAFGVKPTTIQAVVERKSWKHVP